MLLALDVGNTNITIGAFIGETLTGRWRLRTIREQTVDEWGILLRNIFSLAGLDLDGVHGIVICSVVPVINPMLAAMVKKYFQREAMFVTSGTDLGLKVLYDNPREVGADRVVNAVAAWQRFGGPSVVVDLGTAITFDVVSAAGEYRGGLICAGIGMAISGLFSKTALLPMVNFGAPEKLIGTNTMGSIQSGLYYGTLGMIDGILDRLVDELGPATTIIATGGNAELLREGSRRIQHVDEDLTLTGLRLIWERSRS
jgi:type III pantothenate kinase